MGKRCALVIGHGDDADLLDRNLRHHLAMGAGPIVVSTLGPDAAVAGIVRAFGGNVMHRVAGLGDEDPVRYFELAARDLEREFSPAWIGFIDTDEFIVTRSGRFDEPRAHYDLWALRRYNAVPKRLAGGAAAAPDLDDLRSTPLATSTIAIEDAWAASDTSVAYVEGLDLGSKIIIRPKILSEISVGAHAVCTGATFVPRGVDRDALIVHVPFTTFERFRRKISAVRGLLATYGDRFDPWHWRHWASMTEAELEAEFERQVFDVERNANVASADAILATLAALPDDLDWLFSARTLQHEPAASVGTGHVAAGTATIAAIVDRVTYASRYTDLARAVRVDGIDVVEHFLAAGIIEGRRPSYAFDPDTVAPELERRLGRELGSRDLWWKYFDLPQAQRPIPNAWFDPVWFQETYGAHADDWSAFSYYLANVAGRAFSPNAWFDEPAYRDAHPALVAAIAEGTFVSGVQHAYATLDGAGPLAP